MDFLRGADDDRADRALYADRHAAYLAMGRQTCGRCPRCHAEDAILAHGVCLACEDAAAWSRANRLFCDLLHRG